MLLGEFQHSLDAKGRLIVPSRLRYGLGQRFILTKGIDSCLFAFPENEWKTFEEKLAKLPLTHKDSRKFVRYFFSGAAELEIDSQGRIMIPTNLREHANLTKEVTTIGVANRVEIWDKLAWQEYNEEDGFSDNELAEKLDQLDLFI